MTPSEIFEHINASVQGDTITLLFVIAILATSVLLCGAEVFLWLRLPVRRTKKALKLLGNKLTEVTAESREMTGDDRIVAILGAVLVQSGSKLELWKGRVVARSYPPSLLTGAQSPVQFAPALLTALGVIGTFLGISLGLLDFTGLGEDSNATINSVMGLIAGMKTAFFTSLVGLTCAAFAMLGLAVANGTRSRHLKESKDLWEELTIDISEVQSQRLIGFFEVIASPELAEQQQKAAAAQSAAAEQLAEAVSDMRQSLSGFNAEAIGEHVKEGFQQTMRAEVVPVFTDMKEQLVGIRKVMESQDERIMRALLEGLRTEVIEPLAEQIVDSAAATKQASEAVTTLHQELGDISTRLAGAAEQLGIFQTQTLQSMNDFASRLEGTLAHFQAETSTILQGVAASMKEAVDQSVEAMAGQRVAFEESATKAESTFRGIREELQTALAAQAEEQREMLQTTREGVLRVLSQAQETFDRQSSVLEKTGQEACGLMDASRQALQSTLEGIDSELQATRMTVEMELERFRRAYQASLESFFQEQNNLLEQTLGEQREGLHSVVEELQGVFAAEAERQSRRQQAMDEHFQKLAISMREVQELSEAILATSSTGMLHVREAAQEINREVLGLRRQYGDLDATFRTALGDGQEALAMYLDEAQSAYNKHFERMDEATARIHERLLSTANYLALSEERRQSVQASF